MPKTIPATNDPSVLFLVDEEDYEDLVRFGWYSQQGYAQGTAAEVAGVPMHRYLLGKRFDLTGMEVDHWNGLKGDNRKANLRVCTPVQNMANRPKQANNTSGFKGVIRDKKRWGARVGGVLVGNFPTVEEAAVAYDIVAYRLYGEFARLNMSTPDPEMKARVEAKIASAKKREGRSRYRGVSFYNRWKARVKQAGRAIHLGFFDTEEAAARAVDAATVRLGLGRPLNFPQSTTP